MRAESTILSFALSSVLLFGVACGQNLASKPASSGDTPTDTPASPCAGGAVKDDGSVETGYGYVPSATMGQYVQEFHADEIGSRELSKVCVCWLRSRSDDALDFEVVFFEQEGDRPAPNPYAQVAATATEVPKGVDEAGRLYEVDVTGVTVPEGTSYIGVRWNPSADDLFFVCTDTSEETEYVNVFSAETLSPRWKNIKDSRDRIFRPHRAILVRAQ